MKIKTAVVVLIFLAACHSPTNNQSAQSDELTVAEPEITIDPYEYNTTLSGGYTLKYSVYRDEENDEMLQSLTLLNQGSPVEMISETSYPMLHKNLGYVGADFKHSFAFVQSYGSGNPHLVQLIDKRSGRALREGFWVDADEQEAVLLFLDNPKEASPPFILLDIKHEHEIAVTEFQDSKCVEEEIGGLRNCVQIDSVTDTEIVLKVEWQDEIIRQTYPRS